MQITRLFTVPADTFLNVKWSQRPNFAGLQRHTESAWCLIKQRYAVDASQDPLNLLGFRLFNLKSFSRGDFPVLIDTINEARSHNEVLFSISHS